MIDLDPWIEVFGSLRRHAMRSTLTAIGVFWGIFMLVVMVGFGNALEGGVRRDMAGLATKSLFVWGWRSSLPYDGLLPGRMIHFTRADANALAQTIPEIEVVAPRAFLNNQRGAVVTRGVLSGSFTIIGDVPEIFGIQPQNILAGRFLSALDMQRNRKVAVIGSHVVDILFRGGGDPIGQAVTIQGTEFVVVGVTKSFATGDQAERLANNIYVPLSTFQQALRPEPRVEYMAILVRDHADTTEIDKRIHLELAKRLRVSPDDKDAIQSWNADAEFAKIANLFVGISALIWIVGSVTLLAGIIGVSNIMLISVRERTREIGIRRAIGATPSSIVAQILKESTVLTATAGYLGILGGTGALELAGYLMSTSDNKGPSMFDAPHADFHIAVAAAAAVVVGGIIAGFFPAWNAVRIRPVVALRDE